MMMMTKLSKLSFLLIVVLFLVLQLLQQQQQVNAKEEENFAWNFKESVNGQIYEAGKHTELLQVPYPKSSDLSSTDIIVKVLATSVIPSHRGRLDPDSWPSKQSDYGPFTVGQPVDVECVVEILETKDDINYPVGNYLTGSFPLIKYQIVDTSNPSFQAMTTPVAKGIVPIEKYLSITSIGGGLTSFYAVEYLDIGQVDCINDERKTILVTSAASTVGQIVGQLYKNKGCYVIGSTSTKAKADAIMDLGGFDQIIAYKEEDFEEKLEEYAPDGIDLDFENVGGTQLDAALRNMKPFGKVMLCGFIADIDKPADQRHGIKEAAQIVLKRITVKGLLVLDILPYIGEAIGKMSKMIQDGDLKSKETIIYGFEQWGEAINMMLRSENIGRLVIKTDHSADFVPTEEL